MNITIKISIITLLFHTNLWAQSDSKDFKFDPKTSSVIPNYVGKIILSKGEVSALNKKGQRSLSIGSKVYKEDTLQTQKASIAKIEMVDSTIVTLGVKSQMKFDKWDYRTRKDRNAVINLMKGKIRTHFKVKSKRANQLKLKVGHVSMGVRGTKILGSTIVQKNGDQVSQVAVVEGSGVLVDIENDVEKKMLTGDHYISLKRVSGKKGVSRHNKLSQSKLKHLLATQISADRGFRPMLDDVQFEFSSGGQQNRRVNPNSKKGSSYRGQKHKRKSWKDKLDELNQRLHENE